MSFYRIRPKSGTTTQWVTTNRVLGEREIGFEYVENGVGKGLVRMKMGDGVTPWNDLPYALDRNMTMDDLSQLITQNNTTIDSKITEVKKLLANGKILVANVVGGNSDTTFQTLANNAQIIKNDRDSKLSQVNGLNKQVNSLNTQIATITQDRNNWMNIANGKVYKKSGRIIKGSYTDIELNFINDNVLIFHIDNGTYPSFAVFRVLNNKIYYLSFSTLVNNSDVKTGRLYGYSEGANLTLKNYTFVDGTIIWGSNKATFHATQLYNYPIDYYLYY